MESEEFSSKWQNIFTEARHKVLVWERVLLPKQPETLDEKSVLQYQEKLAPFLRRAEIKPLWWLSCFVIILLTSIPLLCVGLGLLGFVMLNLLLEDVEISIHDLSEKTKNTFVVTHIVIFLLFLVVYFFTHHFEAIWAMLTGGTLTGSWDFWSVVLKAFAYMVFFVFFVEGAKLYAFFIGLVVCAPSVIFLVLVLFGVYLCYFVALFCWIALGWFYPKYFDEDFTEKAGVLTNQLRTAQRTRWAFGNRSFWGLLGFTVIYIPALSIALYSMYQLYFVWFQ